MDLEVSCKKTNWPAWVCVHLRRGYRTCSIPCLGALWPWPHSYLMDMNKKKLLFFFPLASILFTKQDYSWFVYTQGCVSVCQELAKQKHASHWCYLLCGNLNICTDSDVSGEALQIATKIAILMYSNSLFYGIYIFWKKNVFIIIYIK